MAQETAREFSTPPANKAANDAYLKIHDSFLNQNYTEVDQLANTYLAGGTGQSNAEDALYLQALSLLKLNRADEARVKLRELENSFTAIDRKASASASIADSYFYEGNYTQAYDAYQETLRKYPNSDQTNYALFKLEELSSRLGKPPLNESTYHLSTAPRAPFLTPPQQQMSIEEIPFFTVQVGSFSKARNANVLVRKLSGRRYDAYIGRDPSSGMYRVRVGKFESKTDALAIESRLKKEGYPTKIYP